MRSMLLLSITYAVVNYELDSFNRCSSSPSF